MTVQWQKVHVFVSSTFNDMHAERDYLVKRVFPELADWCERRKLRLVDVDLRWGVTEADATANANVVRTCLKRIDDCRPFFVCLLGQRYGWAPTKDDVSAETLSEYPHLRAALDVGASVTEMEILHAIVKPFRDAPADKADDSHYQVAEHSFFYLRDADYLDDVPADPPVLRRTYTDEAEEDPDKCDALRGKLRTLREETIPATHRPIRRYRATWNPDARTPEITLQPACPALLDANAQRWRDDWVKVLGPAAAEGDRELPPALRDAADAYNERLTAGRLTHFTRTDGDEAGEDLAATILRDLKAAIAARYPDHVEVEYATGLQRELDQQEQFLYLNSEGFIERGNDLGELDDYVSSDSQRLLVLTAEGGMGKSMLLANWIDRCRREPKRHPGATFHVRFIGQSDGSSSVEGLLRLLLEELGDVAGKLPRTAIEKQTYPDGRKREVEVPFEMPADPSKIPQFWKEQLPRLGERGRTVIVIDGLNQLEGGLRNVSWLPLQGLPPGVKLIVSFRSGAEGAAKLIDRLEQNPHVQFDDVAPFKNVADRKRLVAGYLDQYLKELDDQHVDQLVGAVGAANPLYLKVVLSELRVFGSFRGLREKIEHDFGPTPVTAFGALLRRLEGDPNHTAVDPKQVVPMLFGLLLHARRGLSAGELTELVVDQLKLQEQRREDVAEAVQVLLRQAVAFLGRRDGLFDYFFESFELAIRDRYVVGGDGVADAARPLTDWHAALADFFDGQPLIVATGEKEAATRRKLDEQAYQQANAHAWPGLQGTLTGFDFLHAKLKWLGYEALAEDYTIAVASGYPDRDVALVQNALALGAGALRDDDRQLPGQLVGRLMLAEEPKAVALVAEAREHPSWPWLEPLGPTLIQAGGPLLHTLEGHTSLVTSVAVSPDGRLAVSASLDHTVRVWDVQAGALLHTLEGHTGDVRSVAVSPDGRRAVSGGGSDDRTARIWDLEAGRLLNTVGGHTGEVVSVAVSWDGRWAVSGLDTGVCVWHLESGLLRHALVGHTGRVTSVALSGDGRRGVSGAADGTVRVWDLEAGRLHRTLEGHSAPVASVAVSRDGRRAISGGGSGDATVRVWDLEAGRLLHTLNGHMFPESFQATDAFYRSLESIASHLSVTYVDVSPDGRRAVSLVGGRPVRIWDLEAGRLLYMLTDHTGVVESIAASRDWRRAVSGASDQTVRVWDLAAGQLMGTLEGHASPVTSVAVTLDGRRGVSGAADGAVRVWDLRTCETRQTPPPHTASVLTVAATSDGRRGVSGAADGTVRVWDLQGCGPRLTPVRDTGTVISIAVSLDGRRTVSGGEDGNVRVWDLQARVLLFTLQGHTDGVVSVAVSPNGRWAVSGGSDKTVRVWDLDVGRLLCTLAGHTDTVLAVCMSRDDRRAVSGSEDGTVRVWDVPSGKPLHTLEGHADSVWSVAVTPDGRRAVSAGKDRTVRVWDAEAGGLLHTLEGHTGTVGSVTLSPDGRRAVSMSQDMTVRVWDLEAGHLLRTLEGHTDSVWSVAVSPDGRRAVAGGGRDDGTVRVWDLDAGRLVHTMEGHTSYVRSVAVSPDARRVVSAGGDKTVRVWDLALGTETARYTADGPLHCLGTSRSLVVTSTVGDGKLHVLSTRNCTLGPQIVTARRSSSPSERTPAVAEAAIAALCPSCGTMLGLGADRLGREIACTDCGAEVRLNSVAVHEFGTPDAGLADHVNRLARRLLGRS